MADAEPSGSADTLPPMNTLPDLTNLPDDLAELGRLLDAPRAHCQALVDEQPDAYAVVDGQVVLTFTPQHQQDELNAARKVCQAIAVKMSGLRLEAKASA